MSRSESDAVDEEDVEGSTVDVIGGSCTMAGGTMSVTDLGVESKSVDVAGERAAAAEVENQMRVMSAATAMAVSGGTATESQSSSATVFTGSGSACAAQPEKR